MADQEPDPKMFWSWVGTSLRPVAGWLFAALGIAAILMGYLGVSREAIVAKQIPFLVSGGLLGIGLLFLGGALIGTQDVKGHGSRISRLEGLVADLHRVLLEDADTDVSATADPTVTTPFERPANPNGVATVLVTPTGGTFHADDCQIVSGRDDVSRISQSEAAGRSLQPCKVCDPMSISAEAAKA